MTREQARDRAAVVAAQLGHSMFWWRALGGWCGNCHDCGREAYVGRLGTAGSALEVACAGFRATRDGY